MLGATVGGTGTENPHPNFLVRLFGCNKVFLITDIDDNIITTQEYNQEKYSLKLTNFQFGPISLNFSFSDFHRSGFLRSNRHSLRKCLRNLKNVVQMILHSTFKSNSLHNLFNQYLLGD